MIVHTLYVASAIITALALAGAAAWALFAWAERRVNRICQDALDQPPPYDWADEAPRVTPDRRHRPHRDWRDECTR
jgi:hypothetical protein